MRLPGAKPPCACGTYSTQEAGTRAPYVQYGGPGARVSAQAVTCSAAASVTDCLQLGPGGSGPSIWTSKNWTQ